MHEQTTAEQRSTEGMVDYDQNSSAQQVIISTQRERVRGLVERIRPVNSELRIVDYGCGPGTSAIIAVAPAIETCRRVHPSVQLVVCHADQPGNDWNSLFGLVWGPSGYRRGADRIRTEAAIGSFYEQMVGEASVDFGTCFVASHWLDHAVRLHSPGSLWFADLTGAARREMAEQARRDWTRFLRQRAKELRPGAFLFVSTLGSVPDASEINGTAASGRGIYRALQVVAQGMADDGLIAGSVLDEFVFSLWFLTAEEARQPIVDDPDLSRAFGIETISVEPAPENPTDFFAGLLSDPARYADAYTGYIRAFADSTLRIQLFGPSASDPTEERALAATFYARLNALYRTHLDEYAFEQWLLTVVLHRR
jgi:SAM dependent carboxyl methyltransferase